MSIGGSIFLIAVGAILRYATDFDISSVDMDVVGLILMLAGIAALLLSLAVMIFQSDGGGNQPPPGSGPPR